MTIRNGSYANMLVVKITGQFRVEEQGLFPINSTAASKASRQAKACLSIEIWFINFLVVLTTN